MINIFNLLSSINNRNTCYGYVLVCFSLSFQPNTDPKVTVGIESPSSSLENAMTAWVQKYQYRNETRYQVCARELQNFDGRHIGFKIVSLSSCSHNLTIILTIH